jgi:cold shock CspA family protein/ribosome-associated translation inhibitor RaiA
MQAPLQVAFHNVEGAESVRALIEEKVAWLEKTYDRITHCRVVVESPHRRHRRSNQFLVRIDLTVPGAEIAVNREPTKRDEACDLAVAIRDAFDAARRRLDEHVRRRRQQVKSHEAPPHSRVSRLFPTEGYGFLSTTDGREIYFHHRAVLNGGFGDLQVGSEVAFVEEAGDKGPQASTVRSVGRHNHE